MKLFINGRFLTQQITGVQRFALELSKELAVLNKDLFFLVPSLDAVVEKNMLDILNIIEVKGGEGHFWEQFTLPKYLKNIGSPLLINFCNTSPIIYKNKISTIHDIIFVRYPQSFSLKFRLFYKFIIPLILKSSRKILTVSEFSKKDIAEYYSYDFKKISVIYNAISSDFRPYLEEKKIDIPFALAVSSPSYHKNFVTMINAFLEANIDMHLKIIGSASGVFQKINISIKDMSRIQFLGRISDSELIQLYQNANFFIFPSLYEGFGIPPLEAQACNCPVISSNAASLPEVLGDSAYFFDPRNIKEIKAAIQLISLNNSLRDTLKHRGSINVKRFSWKNSAKKLNDILNEISNK